MSARIERDVVVTGVGLVTSLGEGGEAVRDALLGGAEAVLDTSTTAPFPIHPLVALDYDKQIPKKGDQRQMEPWQRMGTYAAGLALSHAGIAGNQDLLSRTHMIVAAGGGERDVAVDEALMAALKGRNDYGAMLNERLSSDLRPTLFLAQLPNLLAGNISIVHGVTGSSRTFMGEESSGIDALRTVHARIASGQIALGLVGGAYSAPRQDMILLFSFMRGLLPEPFAPVWERAARGGGMVLGSLAAFLVLEDREHAEARGQRALAKVSAVLADRTARGSGAVRGKLADLWGRIEPRLRPGPVGILSGATGIEPATGEERAFFEDTAAARPLFVRATGSAIGHSVEPAPIANTALAALALDSGVFYPPLDSSGVEDAAAVAPGQIVVTSIAHWRGEGLILVETA